MLPSQSFQYTPVGVLRLLHKRGEVDDLGYGEFRSNGVFQFSGSPPAQSITVDRLDSLMRAVGSWGEMVRVLRQDHGLPAPAAGRGEMYTLLERCYSERHPETEEYSVFCARRDNAGYDLYALCFWMANEQYAEAIDGKFTFMPGFPQIAVKGLRRMMRTTNYFHILCSWLEGYGWQYDNVQMHPATDRLFEAFTAIREQSPWEAKVIGEPLGPSSCSVMPRVMAPDAADEIGPWEAKEAALAAAIIAGSRPTEESEKGEEPMDYADMESVVGALVSKGCLAADVDEEGPYFQWTKSGDGFGAAELEGILARACSFAAARDALMDMGALADPVTVEFEEEVLKQAWAAVRAKHKAAKSRKTGGKMTARNSKTRKPAVVDVEEIDEEEDYGEESEGTSLSTKLVDTMDEARGELLDGAWRAGALEVLDAAKIPARKLITTHLPSIAADVLDTEYGEAALAWCTGQGIRLSPYNENPKINRLGKELRVHGFAILSRRLLKVVINPIKAVIFDVAGKLPDMPDDLPPVNSEK